MGVLTRFLRGVLGALVVIGLILLTVALSWGLGVGIAAAFDIDATAPVIVCMLTGLLVLGLWMEPPDRFKRIAEGPARRPERAAPREPSSNAPHVRDLR